MGPDRIVKPSTGAVDLLLKLIEAETRVFRIQGLDALDEAGTRELIRNGLLVPAGHEFTVVGRGAIFPVNFDQQRNTYGYFDPDEGWVAISKADLAIHRLDFRSVAIAFLGEELRMSDRHPEPLCNDRLYAIGSYPFFRGPPTDVWLARRMVTAADARFVAEVANRRPSGQPRLVLTPTAPDRLADTRIDGINIVSIGDVTGSGSDTLVDIETLRMRMEGRDRVGGSEPIWLSDDNRHLNVLGDEFVFRGPIMQRAIRFLFEAYQNRKPIKLEELLTESRSGSKDLESLFGNHWLHLKKHVLSQGGFHRLTAD